MKVTELIPTNGRKSFGGKAKVLEDDSKIQLMSYTTIVAEYNKKSGEYSENGKYSNTTNSHIKAFKNFLNL